MKNMKKVQIVSAKEGRIRLKVKKVYHGVVYDLLRKTLKDEKIVSKPFTDSITISCYKCESILPLIKKVLKENGFKVETKGDEINLLFAFQLMLNVGGGLEGIAFNVAKDIVLDRMGLGAISYLV
ncbi:MAG TPA: hypothetical protein DIC27_00850 [Hydrogenobaculum sp.]|nr:hypothetical protein [Hydrogenobaculum sp.]